jgi:hypothetical protein
MKKLTLLTLLATGVSVSAQTWVAFGGHEYALSDQPYDWASAQTYAVSLGVNLVTINDAAEDGWLWNSFLPNSGQQGFFWTGFNDVATEGTFVWSSGEAVTYTNWEAGEPNNLGDEDAMHLGRFGGGTWNDDTVNGRSYAILERPIPEPSTYAAIGAVGALAGWTLWRRRR